MLSASSTVQCVVGWIAIGLAAYVFGALFVGRGLPKRFTRDAEL